MVSPSHWFHFFYNQDDSKMSVSVPKDGDLDLFTSYFWLNNKPKWRQIGWPVESFLSTRVTSKLELLWKNTADSRYNYCLISCIVAWKIPWTEEPGWLLFMGLQRVRHDWATSLSIPHSRDQPRIWRTQNLSRILRNLAGVRILYGVRKMYLWQKKQSSDHLSIPPRN